MTVVLIASRDDLHADAVLASLTSRANCLRVDPTEQATVSFESNTERMSIEGMEVIPSDVTGVYCRFPLEASAPDGGGPVVHFSREENLASLRGVLLSIAPDRWINYPWHENAADGKVYPLMLARGLGLSVPEFIVTSSLEHLDRWLVRFPGEHVIKPLSDTSIARQDGAYVQVPGFSAFSAPYTAPFDRSVLDETKIDGTPFLVQIRVSKVSERRVVVIDDSVIATETEVSPACPTDIRLRTSRVEIVSNLSDADRLAVLDLRKKLGLRFMSLDFAVDALGTSWLLDINPAGNWLWQEQQLSLGIPMRLATALTAN